MPRSKKNELTAAQEILLGASDLDSSGKTDFTEWDLTVSTWKRNPNRFGCRGYEPQYPDHKRVMMEIMSAKKKDNPIRRGWLQRTKPNTYQLTNLGRTEIGKLLSLRETTGKTTRSPQSVYDAVAPLYKSNVFRKHSKNKDEPRMWLGAAAFLQVATNDAQHVKDRIRATDESIDNALEWLDENNENAIRRGVSGGSEAISKDSLLQLKKFSSLLQDRFKNQITALTKSK